MKKLINYFSIFTIFAFIILSCTKNDEVMPKTDNPNDYSALVGHWSPLKGSPADAKTIFISTATDGNGSYTTFELIGSNSDVIDWIYNISADSVMTLYPCDIHGNRILTSDYGSWKYKIKYFSKTLGLLELRDMNGTNLDINYSNSDVNN